MRSLDGIAGSCPHNDITTWVYNDFSTPGSKMTLEKIVKPHDNPALQLQLFAHHPSFTLLESPYTGPAQLSSLLIAALL